MPILPEISNAILPDRLELFPLSQPRLLKSNMSLGDDRLLPIALLDPDGLLVEVDTPLDEVAADVSKVGGSDGDPDGGRPIESTDGCSSLDIVLGIEAEDAFDELDGRFDPADNGIVGSLDSPPDPLEELGDLAKDRL